MPPREMAGQVPYPPQRQVLGEIRRRALHPTPETFLYNCAFGPTFVSFLCADMVSDLPGPAGEPSFARDTGGPAIRRQIIEGDKLVAMNRRGDTDVRPGSAMR